MPLAFTHVEALVPIVKVFLGRGLGRQVGLDELVRVVPVGVASTLSNDEEQMEISSCHGNSN